ncbi:unnamed protein product [Discosporangium mesarthrocarpum]
MEQNELALKKAIASGDDNLVYLVLMHLEKEGLGGSGMGKEAFYKMVYAFPEAVNLLKAYYRQRAGYAERRRLHDLCEWRGNHLEAGTLAVRQAFLQERLEARLEGLKEAENLFGRKKELSFQQAATRDQIELLEIQRDLEQKTGLPVFIDLSVSETIYHLISIAATQPAGGAVDGGSLMGEAAQLQKRLRVPDKRFWHLKIKALASSGQWDALRSFCAERKSPVGYKPFAVACMRHGQPARETEQYIDKVQQAEDRYDLYIEMGLWEKAAETATRLKDPRRIAEVHNLAVTVDGGRAEDAATSRITPK